MSFPVVSLFSSKVLTLSSLRTFRYVRIQLFTGFCCVPPAQNFRFSSLIRIKCSVPFVAANLV